VNYQPLAAVWEITMGCNMRCKHCGSGCKTALPGELTTEEALSLCDDLGELGLKWVTVSGGEPLTRPDWHIIAKRLKDNGVAPLLITNGWLLNEDVVRKAEASGIESFAMSLDGIKETHDFMRMPGSFDRIMAGFDLLSNTSLVKSAITTVNKKNIKELEALKEILLEKEVKLWQLQIGLPMGNFADNQDLVLEPEQVDEIIDFAYSMLSEDRISIYLADCLGYYNLKEIAVREKTFRTKNVMWQGCTAGKHSLGILHNGDILGCTSIRDRDFIEGNIRKTPLKAIWNSKDSFLWSRTMSKEKLSGFCNKCGYGDVCIGGCPNTRLTLNKGIHSDNNYCSYHVAIKKAAQKIIHESDGSKLFAIGKNLASKNEFQLSELVMEKALKLDGNNIDILNYYGFISFMLKNYETAKAANEKVLKLQDKNVYALKGLGLSLVKLGEINKGIDLLRQSTNLADENYLEPYYDLAITLIENHMISEANEVIAEGLAKSPSFKETADYLKTIINNELSKINLA